MLKSFRSLSLASALMGVLMFVAACSGPSNSLSPTSPSGTASAAAAGSAVSGAMGDEVPVECDPKTEDCEPPSECDPKTEDCEPPPSGDQGCTPGYWKNHLDSWGPTGYATGQALTSVFGSNALDGSLLDGLGFGGGSGTEGAKRILLRAAVAALLNSSHPGVDYPRTTGQVIGAVQTALNSGDRGTMLALATALDIDNNLGCPLS